MKAFSTPRWLRSAIAPNPIIPALARRSTATLRPSFILPFDITVPPRRGA
jgi:hypothetical protein